MSEKVETVKQLLELPVHRTPFVAAIVAMLLGATSAPAAVLNFIDAPPSGGTGTDYRIESIIDFDIGGTSYDATFHYGEMSYDDLVASVPMPITFGTTPEADQANTAVAAAINAPLIDASGASAFTGTYYIPYLEQGLSINLDYGWKTGNNPLSYDAVPGTNSFHRSLVTLPPNDAWITFAESQGSGSAALISVDYQSIGDGLLTHDLDNGLEWLDLTETAGLTYDYVSANLGPSGAFEGFRYANDVEVKGLFISAGVPEPVVNVSTANYAGVTNLIGFVGDLGQGDGGGYGVTSLDGSDLGSPGTHIRSLLQLFGSSGVANNRHTFFDDATSDSFTGHWLIRDATAFPVDPGSGVAGSVGGGSDTTGGVDVLFDDVTGSGSFTAEYDTPNPADLSALLPPGAEPLINFGLPGDPAQVRNIDFDGTFTGDVFLTLSYDDTILSVLEADLGLWHFDAGAWVQETSGFILDTVANTITVEVGSFSPFMLGVAVPEPTTYAMAIVGLVALGFMSLRRKGGWRRKRA